MLSANNVYILFFFLRVTFIFSHGRIDSILLGQNIQPIVSERKGSKYSESVYTLWNINSGHIHSASAANLGSITLLGPKTLK